MTEVLVIHAVCMHTACVSTLAKVRLSVVRRVLQDDCAHGSSLAQHIYTFDALWAARGAWAAVDAMVPPACVAHALVRL